MYKTEFKEAFKTSIPVLVGYLSIGIAFGLMFEKIGYNFLWAGFTSFMVYSGALQYIAVGLFAAGTSLLGIAMMTLFVNFRHMVYGISLIDKLKNMPPIKKAYTIFALTDETYALLCSAKIPENVKNKEQYYFYLALLDHSYWIIGSMIGAGLGYLITFNTTGIDFAMTALFVVLALEQWESSKSKLPSLIGGGAGVLSLIIFGAGNMMIPAILAIVGILIIIERKEEDKIL